MDDQERTGPAQHVSVLLAEVIEALRPTPGCSFIDGTLGAGGHAQALLDASAPGGRLLGFDRDGSALEAARVRLAPYGERLVTAHASYMQMGQIAPALGFTQVDGVLLDLGFSSLQVDDPARGFAFRHAGPLDMRYDPASGLTAADIVNGWPEAELADLIYEYGEDRHSRRIARAIIAARPLETTRQLADVIAAAVPGAGRERIHPATRTFQALRIAVNEELAHLEAVLPQALDLLRPGGRLAVISFHSLEDRLVKNFLRDAARDWLPDPTDPRGGRPVEPSLRPVTKKPITAADEEIAANPRARSAKLRVAERV